MISLSGFSGPVLPHFSSMCCPALPFSILASSRGWFSSRQRLRCWWACVSHSRALAVTSDAASASKILKHLATSTRMKIRRFLALKSQINLKRLARGKMAKIRELLKIIRIMDHRPVVINISNFRHRLAWGTRSKICQRRDVTQKMASLWAINLIRGKMIWLSSNLAWQIRRFWPWY